MKRFSLCLAALLILNAAIQAGPIATIDGAYDDLQFDTPNLVFHNTTAANLDGPYTFTNVVLTLHGYQGVNNGLIQSRNLADMPVGDSNYIWTEGFATKGNLFTYDYDDSEGAVVGAQPGNFDVTFTAILSGAGIYNGQAIFSQFSPANNASGGFVGWEGLDPGGFAETAYDAHNGTVGGTLAYIFIGTPVDAPEPATMSLLGISLMGAAGMKLRRRARIVA